MKFTATTLLFTLGAFIASCSAACTCSASDQKCIDKCVMTANTCIETCKTKGSGNACQESCLASNWPSMPVIQKDVLATSNSMAESATASLMATTSMPTSMMSGSASGSMTSTLSGRNPSMSGTLARPSGENLNHSSGAAGSRQILSAVGMVTVMVTVATYFF